MTTDYISPDTSDKDAVRFLVGDTGPTDWYLQDEEITWALAQQSTVHMAAAVCAEAIAGQLARLADLSLDDTSISYSQRHRHYMDLAERLRETPTSSLSDAASGGTDADGLYQDREPYFTFEHFDSTAYLPPELLPNYEES